MKKLYILLFSFTFFTTIGNAQTDTDFWFVVPEGTSGHGGSEPVYVHLAALDADAIITIDMPRNGTFTPRTFTIPAKGTKKLDLTWYIRSGFTQPIDILTSPTLPNTIGTANENNIMESGLAATTGAIENKGVHITSTALITAYLERRVTNNPEIWALKGANALGTDFYVPSQTSRPNGGYTPTPYNAIDIVATEDTRVYFRSPVAIQNIGAANTTYFRDLLKGQSICLRATAQTAIAHLGGTHVWSDGNIVVQWKDDSVSGDGGCFDMNGDQMIPTRLAGNEYIVMRGQLTNSREYVWIMPLQTGTIIDFAVVSGVAPASITLGAPGTQNKIMLNNKNGTYNDPLPVPQNVINALHIRSRNGEPFIVYHLTGFGCEMGAAVLPTIRGCTGSTEVSFMRSTNEGFFLNIMCKEAHIDDFTITLNNINYAIPSAWFTEIPGTGASATTDWWYLDKAFNEFTNAHGGIPAVPVGVTSKVSNSTGLFHLGLINGGTTSGCRYGYFSDFDDNYGSAVIASSESDYLKYCYKDTITLQASGGISYLWENASIPFVDNTFVDSKTIATTRVKPPPGYHIYNSTITRPCYLGPSPDTVIPVTAYGYPEMKAAFDTAQIGPDCCSPYEMKYINTTLNANKHEWTFERVTDTLISIVQNPEIIYFSNKTYATKNVKTLLKVSYSGNCPDTTSKKIPIKPQITAAGSKGAKVGCQQDVTKSYVVDTTGAGPITSVYWNWGDGQEQETLVGALGTPPFVYNHRFTNLNNYDTNYFVTLVFIDDVHDCRDTLTPPYMDTVFVPGVARARFTVDKDKGCSPHTVAFDNRSNGDVTYEWDFGNGTHLALTGNDTSVTFINNTVSPIAYYINLTITKANDDGSFCYDTYLDTITVYPQFNTVISPVGSIEGCNPLTVDFSQTTTPNVPNLLYEWDFGNGSTSGSPDPAPKQFSHIMNTDQPYVVKLKTTSEYGCTSTATPVNVNVFAYVDAKFTVAPDTVGCSPFTLQVANNSHINSVKNFVWTIPDNLGDTPSDVAPFNVKFTNTTTAPVIKTITLSNSNLHGCPVTYTKSITVNPEITSSFTKPLGGDTLCNNESVVFTNASYFTGDVATKITTSSPTVTFLWEFGDGTTSAVENPTKSYNNVNTGLQRYYVKLTLTLNGCSSIHTDSVFVYPQMLAQFNTANVNVCAPATVVLNNTSLAANTYLWQFSDGTASVIRSDKNSINYLVDNLNPNSVIQSKVFLTAASSNCSHKDSLTLNVYPHIVPLVVPDVISGCGPLTVVLANQTTGGDVTNPLTYLWNFGDSQNSTLSDAFVSHTFANRTPADAPYTVSLTATNNLACTATSTVVITVFPEIEPKFSFKKNTECSPMQVFMDNSSLNGNQFNWDFGFDGNDTIATGDFFYNFYHIKNGPNTPDTNTIKLVVMDTNHPQCNDSVSQPIIINPKVVASFVVSKDAMGCSPLAAEFTNNSTGYNLTFVWDYKDQNTSGNSDVVHSHIYDNLSATNKTFDVKLTAYDANGCPSATNQTVTRYPKVVANFTIKKDINNTCTPYPIEFSYPETSLNGNSFAWDFGEGNDTSFLTKGTFTHIFDNFTQNTVNTYTVRLTSTDVNTGCTDDTIHTVEVYPHLVPQFKSSNDVYKGCNALTVKFDNQSTGLANYLWDFGDKQTSPEVSPEHIFAHKENKSKEFTVLLKATQTATGCVKDISRKVTVYSYLNPKFGLIQDTKGEAKASELASSGNKATPVLGGCSPFDVVVTDSSTCNGIWYWDFGSVDIDNQKDQVSPDARHLTYFNEDDEGKMKNKQYTIRLIVENVEKCRDTTMQNLEVYPRSQPNFTVTQKGCHPLEVDFKNTSIDDGSSQYYWNLGDGATAIDNSLSHTYFNNSYFDDKVFEVKLSCTTSNLCTDFITKKITVYPKPLAAINPIVDRGCSPLTAELTNKSKATSPVTFLWKFDNGTHPKELTEVTTEKPKYINDNDELEVKNVELIVKTDKGCSDTVLQLVNVYPRAQADFGYYDPSDTAGCSPHEVGFMNLSNTTSTVYYWDFGNGSTSQLRNPTYRYINEAKNDTTFTVKLDVESPYGCKSTISNKIAVYLSPNAEFLAVDPVNLYPDTVITFDNLVKPGPWTFDWDYGNGTSSHNANAQHSKTYTGWGPRDADFSYKVWLKAYSDHCRDSIWQIVTIRPPKPYIRILEHNPLGCMPLQVDYSVTFEYGYEDAIKWNFGDGESSSEPNPTYIYEEPGVYIAMVSIEGDGGVFIDTTKIYVNPLPQPSFEFRPDFVMLPDQPVQFFNTTYLVDESTYLWDFGDATTTTEVQPWHQYTAEGVYDIKLVATTKYGCMDSVMSFAPVTVSGEGFLKFPNAFLPTISSPVDGSYPSPDTENDVFHPIHEGVKNYELWIFNRWGEQLFYSDNILVGWNGRYGGGSGKELGQDVYFWKAKGTYNNDVPFKMAGDVTLIRK